MSKNLVINWYEQLDSTNSQALREAQTAEEGTVWIADYQTAGRGQRGNKWESSKAKNLTFTILFKPEFIHPTHQFTICQISALGVCRYLQDKGLDVKIKWPNDIYIADKKICGMLIEHSISGDKLAVSISGIGLNINQMTFDSDAPNPTSLILEMQKIKNEKVEEFNRKEELTKLLTHIFTLYKDLKEGYAPHIKAEYIDNLYRFNQFYNYMEISQDADVNMPVEKIKEGKIIQAKIIDVDDSGCVVLEQKNGEVKTYPFKGIRYIINK